MAGFDDAAVAELEATWVAGAVALALHRGREDRGVADLVSWGEAHTGGEAIFQPGLFLRQVVISCRVADSSRRLVGSAVAPFLVFAPHQVCLRPVALDFVHEKVEAIGVEVFQDGESTSWEVGLLARQVCIHLILESPDV